MPTDLPSRRQPRIASEVELVAALSLLPLLACMLLVHAYPSLVGAFVLLGQLS